MQGRFWVEAELRVARSRDAGPAGVGFAKALFSGGRWVTGMFAGVECAAKEGIDGIDSISSVIFGAKRGPDGSMSPEVRGTPVGSVSGAIPGSVFTAALFLATLAQVCRCLRRVR